jgi:hypothetical protein
MAVSIISKSLGGRSNLLLNNLNDGYRRYYFRSMLKSNDTF